MVEGARLESVYTGNRIEGSNPSLTAIKKAAILKQLFLYLYYSCIYTIEVFVRSL